MRKACRNLASPHSDQDKGKQSSAFWVVRTILFMFVIHLIKYWCLLYNFKIIWLLHAYDILFRSIFYMYNVNNANTNQNFASINMFWPRRINISIQFGQSYKSDPNQEIVSFLCYTKRLCFSIYIYSINNFNNLMTNL